MKVILVSGGFDPLHSGHISYFNSAKELGDKLIVALNSDDWLVKKKGKFLLPFEERKLIIKSLKMVDDVIGFEDDKKGTCMNALKKAKSVIVEVNQGAPRCHGNCQVHISQVSHIVECSNPIPELACAPLTELDITIGAYVADLIDDGSTLQIGFGGVPNAVCEALKGKKDLGIHTEMVTEGILGLAECGAVNNSKKTWNTNY